MQATAGKGCRGGISKERLGLVPHLPSWFQASPADPLQDTAEPLSRDGGTSEKTLLRKVKTLHESED